ncbi:MAG TPA: toluene hydroxylase [Actinobacteria bacterium]|nr:toluene hydroxylase [Actinomycetota bacterium]
MTTRARKRPRTWSLLGDVRRKPSAYEAVTAKFHYHFRRSPAPWELDPDMPMNRWYLTHREGSPFNVDDWEGFRDPAKLTYKDYVTLQHERELYLDGLVDRFEEAGHAEGYPAGWVDTFRSLVVPLRFPMHVLQMASLYVGQMAPSSFITNCAHFQAADEMRRLQRIAYWTKVVSNAHDDAIATTEAARGPWEDDAAWQPLRETLETMLVAYDWGEAFAALNLAVKPAFDAMVNVGLRDLARRNEDEFIALACEEFDRDAARHRAWTAALVRYALERDGGLAEVLEGWRGSWGPKALAAVEGLAPLFEGAPEPLAAEEVVALARTAQEELAGAAGLG